MQSNTENTQKDPTVCRTCLTPIRGISYRLQEQSGFGKGLMFTHILRYIVPELYLGLSSGPEICYDCKESLRIAYAFRKKCLETETLIGDYLKNMRCTAQVIELSSVIEYIKQFKGKQDAQNILSEWNDDSIEDFPQILQTDGSKPNLFRSETVMTPVPSQPLPEPNMTSILSSSSSRQIIRKIRIPKLCKSAETSYPTKELQNEEALKKESPKLMKMPPLILSTQPKEADKENKTVKRVEVLKVCPQTGLFKNKAGKYLNQHGEELPEFLVQGIKTEKDNTSLSNHQQKEAETKEIIPTLLDKNNQKKVNATEEVDTTKNKKQMNISIENSMNICEETGLLRDQNGHYFDFSGNPLEEEQVKAEKKKAIIRGENLFQISNICTVTEEDFENKKKDLAKTGSADFEDKINMYQITRQVNSKNSTTIPLDSGPHEIIKGLLKPVQNKEFNVEELNSSLQKNNNGFLCNVVSPVNILNFQADENLRIPQQWNPNVKAPKKALKTGLINKKYVYKSKGFIEESDKLSNLNPSTPDINKFFSGLLLKTGTHHRVPSQGATTSTSTQSINKTTEIITETNPKGENTRTGHLPWRIKQEPLDEPEIGPKTDTIDCDNEDTLSAPDLSLDDPNNTNSWQNLINSLDSCETSQYVDIPDFVQIQNFSIEDLLKLRKQTKPQDCNVNFENLNVLKLDSIKDTTMVKPNKKVENIECKLPEKFRYRGKLLVKTADGYTFDECEDTNIETTNKSRNSETGPRKRKKIQMTTVREVRKIPLQDQHKTESGQEVCVLFTNYTYDGVYINDHDYLVSPYIRNKVLFYENKKSYFMCFICGLKHVLKDHVVHMNSHRSKCPSCSENLKSPYMLNIHMKGHTKPCKFCTEIIPFHLIHTHLSKHAQEEEEYEENTFKQINKRMRRGIKCEADEEVTFPGVFPTSLRPRRRRDKLRYNIRETRSREKNQNRKYSKLEDPLSNENSSGQKSKRRITKVDDTTQDTSSTFNNAYVLLERISDDLIREFDVQTILDGTKDEKNETDVESSDKLNIDNYKLAIAEAIKIKVEPKQSYRDIDEESDFDSSVNDTSYSTNVVKRRVGKRLSEKRLKLEAENVDEIKPQTRVLRSSLKKKEESDYQVSDHESEKIQDKKRYKNVTVNKSMFGRLRREKSIVDSTGEEYFDKTTSNDETALDVKSSTEIASDEIIEKSADQVSTGVKSVDEIVSDRKSTVETVSGEKTLAKPDTSEQLVTVNENEEDIMEVQ